MSAQRSTIPAATAAPHPNAHLPVLVFGRFFILGRITSLNDLMIPIVILSSLAQAQPATPSDAALNTFRTTASQVMVHGCLGLIRRARFGSGATCSCSYLGAEVAMAGYEAQRVTSEPRTQERNEPCLQRALAIRD